MGFTAAMIGGFSGTSIHLMTNAMRKVPLSRSPWNHVGGFIFGAYVGNQYHSMEKSLVMDINQIRADKGMPPIVGSNAWIRYAEEE